MALKLIDLSATKKFISKYDPDKKDPSKATVFHLRAIDTKSYMRLMDKMASFNVDTRAGGQQEFLQTNIAQSEVVCTGVQLGVDKIENLQEANGDDVDYKTRKLNFAGKSYVVMKDEILEAIAKKVLDEVWAEIKEISQLDDEEGK